LTIHPRVIFFFHVPETEWLAPLQYQGFRAMKAGLVANVYLEALGVKQHKEKYADIGGTQTEEMKAKIREWAQDGDIYTKLARSLAPEIFGHEDVKKAIILLLIGGVGRTLPDGEETKHSNVGFRMLVHQNICGF
jgi:DNA replicative helicase MCM subunit Mcm2 (Cdc46/Mcm family)